MSRSLKIQHSPKLGSPVTFVRKVEDEKALRKVLPANHIVIDEACTVIFM